MIVREIVGKVKCMNCGEDVSVKRNIKEHLYYNCSWGDGGCGCQFQSRTNDADGHLLRKLNKSDKKEKPAEKEATQEKPAATKQTKKEKGYFAGMLK